MATVGGTVSVADVPQDTRTFLAQVLADGRPVAVELEPGQVAVVTPNHSGSAVASTPSGTGGRAEVDHRRKRTRKLTKAERKAAALAAAGAWADLDSDEMLDELERLDKEVPPTPPIDEL